MSRNAYLVLALVVVGGAAAVLAYRTVPPAGSVASGAEFGGVSLRIEYATTTVARERGLGGRTEVARDYGMLFVFPKDEKHGFWMKDMLSPVDIFWLDAQGHVVSIAGDVATSTYPYVFYPSSPARYVLETAAGFAREHEVKNGTLLLLKNFPIVSE